jgi:hypothetical protein
VSAFNRRGVLSSTWPSSGCGTRLCLLPCIAGADIRLFHQGLHRHDRHSSRRLRSCPVQCVQGLPGICHTVHRQPGCRIMHAARTRCAPACCEDPRPHPSSSGSRHSSSGSSRGSPSAASDASRCYQRRLWGFRAADVGVRAADQAPAQLAAQREGWRHDVAAGGSAAGIART